MNNNFLTVEDTSAFLFDGFEDTRAASGLLDASVRVVIHVTAGLHQSQSAGYDWPSIRVDHVDKKSCACKMGQLFIKFRDSF